MSIVNYEEKQLIGDLSEVKVYFDRELSTNELADLRKSLYDIEIYTIGNVHFHQHDSGVKEETIANKLGLYPIIQEDRFENNDVTASLSAKGPGHVTTDHIFGISYPTTFPIMYLKDNEIIKYKLFINDKGSGLTHEKYCAVSKIRYNLENDKHVIQFINNGCYSTDQILAIFNEDESESEDEF